MKNHILMGNHAQNPSKTNGHRISLFNLFKRTRAGLFLVFSDLPFAQASAQAAEIPAAVIKFSKMEVAR